jgi:hypothetical protein
MPLKRLKYPMPGDIRVALSERGQVEAYHSQPAYP